MIESKPEWIQILVRACKVARDLPHTPEGRTAIEWFNTEYSEEAVRQRREAVDADCRAEKSHRWSALQIPGSEPGKPAEFWRLSAALIDLHHSNPRWGNVEGWSDRATERLEAAKVVLIVALVIDRDAGEYLGDKIDLAGLPKDAHGERLGRGYASITARFDDGDGRWPEIVEGAVAVLTPPARGDGEADQKKSGDDEWYLAGWYDAATKGGLYPDLLKGAAHDGRLNGRKGGKGGTRWQYKFAEVCGLWPQFRFALEAHRNQSEPIGTDRKK